MADTQEQSLTATTTMALTDLIRLVMTPGGTPASDVITLANFQQQLTSLVNITDYVNASQQVRTTATFTKTSDVGLANVPGLSVSLVAGCHYRITARLYTTAVTGGGTKVSVSGTATFSNFVASAVVGSAAAGGQSGITTFGTAFGGVATGASGLTEITGEIDVTAGGTLVIQFAQNASNGTGSVVLVGSTLFVDRMA